MTRATGVSYWEVQKVEATRNEYSGGVIGAMVDPVQRDALASGHVSLRV